MRCKRCLYDVPENLDKCPMCSTPIDHTIPAKLKAEAHRIHIDKRKAVFYIILLVIIAVFGVFAYNTWYKNKDNVGISNFKCYFIYANEQAGGTHNALYNKSVAKFEKDKKDIEGTLIFPADTDMMLPGESNYITVELDKKLPAEIDDIIVVHEGEHIMGTCEITEIIE